MDGSWWFLATFRSCFIASKNPVLSRRRPNFTQFYHWTRKWGEDGEMQHPNRWGSDHLDGSQKLEKNMEWMQLDIIRYPWHSRCHAVTSISERYQESGGRSCCHVGSRDSTGTWLPSAELVAFPRIHSYQLCLTIWTAVMGRCETNASMGEAMISITNILHHRLRRTGYLLFVFTLPPIIMAKLQ